MSRRLKEGEKGERNRSASEGNIEDFLLKKRKRVMRGEEEEKEEEGAFNKSRKTQRSPSGQKDTRAEEGEVRDEGKGWKEEMRDMMMRVMVGMKDIKEIKEQGRSMKEEMEGLRRDMRENEKRWREEKEKLEECIRELKRRVGEMEVSLKKEKKEEREGEGRGGERERREVVEKMKEMEKRLERKERKERRKNILIRGLEVEEEGKRRKAVEEVLEKIGAEVEVEEVRKIGRGEGKTETVWVRLKNEEQRNEVMRMKKTLKGKRERIMEDWTWKERKMRWKLEEIARSEMRKGRKVWMSYGGIKIDEKWWRWDKEEEVLMDGKGMMRKENTGEDMEM